PTTAPTARTTPQSLEEALAAAGLTRVELPERSRQMTHALPDTPAAEGRALRMIETAGWSGGPSVFARRADGTIVRVVARVREIVDRHVPGGCLTFGGGRGWFEEVEYELPQGASYGGDVEVSYEHHTEVVDHATTQEDGSPCRNRRSTDARPRPPSSPLRVIFERQLLRSTVMVTVTVDRIPCRSNPMEAMLDRTASLDAPRGAPRVWIRS
ncbi:MAG: hypothetical protein K8H88_03605, partial [Sandaracinaceae bacterium]|nr:hypothetical protein [Sandaracinaceae bacterium]